MDSSNNSNIVPSIAQLLNIQIPNVPEKIVNPVIAPIDDVIDNDAEFVRQTAMLIVDKGTQALDAISEIARQSQDPRVYRVMNELITALSDASDRIMKLHKDKREVKGETGKSGNVNIANAVFVGSTAQLLKTIKEEDNRIIDGEINKE